MEERNKRGEGGGEERGREGDEAKEEEEKGMKVKEDEKMNRVSDSPVSQQPNRSDHNPPTDNHTLISRSLSLPRSTRRSKPASLAVSPWQRSVQ